MTRIGAALREQNIAFDINAAGDAVSVRPSQTVQARMLLAEKGLPTSANSGYELFDKIGSLGLTSFMQEVTKLRALEGEIARTVQLMKGVKAARVHIVMPVRGSFRATQQPPSASVVLRTDGAIEARTAQSIRHLVAAAIPGMTRDKVTVLDADGSMLLAEEDEASAAPTKMASLQKTVGGMVQENIRKALTPYLGLDNFEVSVAPQLSTDKRQVNETVYDPETRAERSVRNVRENEKSSNADRSTPTTVQQNLPDQQVNAGGTKNSSEDKTAPRGRYQFRGLVQDHDDGQRRLFGQETLHRRPGQSRAACRRPRRQDQPGHRRQQARRDQPARSDRRRTGQGARRPDPGDRGRLRGGLARARAGAADQLRRDDEQAARQRHQRGDDPGRRFDAGLVRASALRSTAF